MTPAVSILVPIYNVSKYIERCAHSLFQQTFEDIEYVFVNDCTPDDSIEKLQKVLEQYSNRKSFVKIIHHEKNRGLATARNTAIDNSTGKYIQHIDSDDWVELDMVETMYNKAEKEQADIVTSGYITEYTKHNKIEKDNIFPTWKENFLHILSEDALACVINKLVKSELYKKADCRPVEGLNYGEDRHTSIRIYFYARKIVNVDKTFYHINRSDENISITSSKRRIHFENTIHFFSSLEEFFKEKNVYEDYKQILEQQKIKFKIHLFFCTNIPSLRYEYRNIFIEEEKKHYNTLKPVKKVMLFCSKRRYLLWITQTLRKLLLLKIKLFS